MAAECVMVTSPIEEQIFLDTVIRKTFNANGFYRRKNKIAASGYLSTILTCLKSQNLLPTETSKEILAHPEVRSLINSKIIESDYLSYSVRNEAQGVRLAELVLNGNFGHYNWEIKDIEERFNGSVLVNHVKEYTPTVEGLPIKTVQVGLKGIEPSLKAKYRRLDTDGSVGDATRLKVVTENKNDLLEVISQFIYDVVPRSEFEVVEPIVNNVLKWDVESYEDLPNDVTQDSLELPGYQCKNKVKKSQFEAVTVHLRGEGKYDTMEVQFVTGAMDKRNNSPDPNEPASHINYLKRRNQFVKTHHPKGPEVITTYELLNEKGKPGKGQVTLDVECVAPCQACYLGSKLKLDFSEYDIQTREQKDYNEKFKPTSPLSHREQYIFEINDKYRHSVLMKLEGVLDDYRNELKDKNMRIAKECSLITEEQLEQSLRKSSVYLPGIEFIPKPTNQEIISH